MVCSHLGYGAHAQCFSVELLLLKLAKQDTLCMEVPEMVFVMAVLVVSYIYRTH